MNDGFSNFRITRMILLAVCFFPLVLFAQKRTVTGYVLDSTGYFPLANAKVANVNTNKSVQTDKRGRFQISATPGDMLFVTAKTYHFRQLKYSMLQDTLFIYMGLLPNELPGVTVYAQGYTRYQQDSIKRLTEFREKMVSPQYEPVSKANSQGAGVGINLDYMSSREKSKRKAKKMFEEEERAAYVNFRFSPELVSSYTGLKGDSLQHFRSKYSPGYDWLRAHTTDEDVLYYINDQLKIYYGRKGQKKYPYPKP